MVPCGKSARARPGSDWPTFDSRRVVSAEACCAALGRRSPSGSGRNNLGEEFRSELILLVQPSVGSAFLAQNVQVAHAIWEDGVVGEYRRLWAASTRRPARALHQHTIRFAPGRASRGCSAMAGGERARDDTARSKRSRNGDRRLPAGDRL